MALAWVLFHPGADASRVYYGTDTHAVGLLAGVALALLWSPVGPAPRHRPGAGAGRCSICTGLLALAYILASFLQVHDYDLSLYHGGYLVLAIATSILIAVLAHPAARLGALLARPPVIWLGLRSYSFYLWHWPVLVLTPVIGIALPKGALIPLQLLVVAGSSPSSPIDSSSCPSAARPSPRPCPMTGFDSPDRRSSFRSSRSSRDRLERDREQRRPPAAARPRRGLDGRIRQGQSQPAGRRVPREQIGRHR